MADNAAAIFRVVVKSEGIGTGKVTGRRRKSLAARPRDSCLRLCSISKPSGCEHLFERFRLEEPAAEQCAIPARQVLHGRTQRARRVRNAHGCEVSVAKFSGYSADQGV